MRAEQQVTDTLFMVRPSVFGFNNETAATNIFQNSSYGKNGSVDQAAANEFDSLVKKLREQKIYVVVLQDPADSGTPDSIFPNNWISFHGNTLILYPLLAENRRKERKKKWIGLLKDSFGIKRTKDFSFFEDRGMFLEGTGSLVLDRKNRIAYSNLSSRTSPELLKNWCAEMKYELVSFTVSTRDSKELYHTNVMMAIGEKTLVACLEVVCKASERSLLLDKLSRNHQVIEISEDQMMLFAGNMLLVKNREGKKFWVMSEQAFQSLTLTQKEALKTDGDFICSDLRTIEGVGGGSARCMIAEIF